MDESVVILVMLLQLPSCEQARELIHKRWRQYLQLLYYLDQSNKQSIQSESEVNKKGENSEFELPLNNLKDNKALCVNNIPAELLKMGGEDLKKRLYQVTSRMYKR